MVDWILTLIALCPFILMFLGIPVLFLIGMFIILRIGLGRTQELHQAWIAFGQSNGLTFDKGSLFVYPKLTGQYRGRSVTLSIYSISHGRTSTYYTVAVTPVRVTPDIQLQVSDRNQTGLFYRTLDGPLLKIGDDRFADKFEVKGNSMALAQSLLTSEIQAEILASGISHLDVQKGLLRLRYRGFQIQPEVLRAMLELLCRAAELAE